MYYYYKRNGDVVDVIDIDENGNKTKIVLDNIDNLNKILENENRLSEIKKYASKATKKYNKLVNDRNRSKLLNKIFIALGLITGVTVGITSSVAVLPYLLGSLVTILPMIGFKTIKKINLYNANHERFKREKDFYVDEFKKEQNLRDKLKKEAKKVKSYDDAKALGYTEYIIRYKDSRAVSYMRKHGYTDLEINKHFIKIKRDIESMEKFNEEQEKNTSLRLTKTI